ncbi:alpha/beta hydrolase [Amycolatopsis anabasis]|uniref:alpha/beta hydrolase n=1 Tax=Amycolatopsis anabasis TaxID=1840409 RepID=UPI00131E1371|nr:alpha/beta hydrolase family protein [Amycolatopsis anabasis]
MTRTRQRRRVPIRALVAALFTGVLVPATGDTAASAAPVTADDGAKVTKETWVDQRTLDLEIQSPALGAKASVRLLVPSGWAKNSGQSWPNLWLLHGCCEVADYQSWTKFTDVEQFTADKPAMIVMPSGGKIGMYSEWWNYGLFGVPDWRKFHLTEVKQILERGYGAGDRRSIAGLSMGGYGAMEYASRVPGMFGAAASYSGAVDVLAPGIPEVTQLNMINQGFFVWGVLWGDPWSQRARWMDHNPADKVDKLRGTKLYVSSGDGKTGPLDDPAGPPPAGALLEDVALGNSRGFVGKLQQGGVPVTVDFYGAGTHTWPYWQFALHRSWPVLASGMGI